MAVLQDINGAQTLKQAWPLIEANEQVINAEVIAHKSNIGIVHTAGAISVNPTGRTKLTGDDVEEVIGQIENEIKQFIGVNANAEVGSAHNSSVKAKTFVDIDARIEETEQDVKSHLSDYTNHKLEIINAVSMGADKTGVIDCTVLLQSLLDTYGIVYFPKGTYLFDKLLLSSHNKLLGDGVFNTILKSTATTGFAITTKNGAVGCNIRDMYIQGIYTGCSGVCLYSDDYNYISARHVLQNVLIRNFTGDGLFLNKYAMENRLLNVVVQGCQGNGFVQDGYGSHLAFCSAASNLKHGFKITNGGTILTSCKSYCNGNSDNGYDGFYISGVEAKAISIIGCNSQQNYRDGLRLADGCSDNVITDLSLLCNNWNNLYDGCAISLVGIKNKNNKISAIVTPAYSKWDSAENYAVKIDDVSALNNEINVKYNHTFTDIDYYTMLAKADNTLVDHKPFAQASNNPLNSVKVDGEEQISVAANDLFALGVTNNNTNSVVNSSVVAGLLTVSMTGYNALVVASGSSFGAEGVTINIPITTEKVLYLTYKIRLEEFYKNFGVMPKIQLNYVKTGGGTNYVTPPSYVNYQYMVATTGWVTIKIAVDFAYVYNLPDYVSMVKALLVFRFIKIREPLDSTKTITAYIKDAKYNLSSITAL